MAKSDLSHRVVSRYQQYEKLRKSILVSRWLLSNQKLAANLREALPELRNGNVKVAVQALDHLWMAFEIHASDDGKLKPHASWYYPLSLEARVRVRELIHGTTSLRAAIEKAVTSEALAKFDGIVRETEWLESILPRTDGFKHGSFQVVPMKGVSSKDLSSSLASLAQAESLIRPTFPEVLYGKVYLGKVALYVQDIDTICLKAGGDVHAACHELGHRYFYRFWNDQSAKENFQKFSPVTKYAELKHSWLENFAEAFALHVTGKTLPSEISAVFSISASH